MNKRDIKYFLINNCPNIKQLRKFLTKKKIESLKARLLPEKEVVYGETGLAEKQRIVEKYTNKWPRYMAEEYDRIERILKDAPCFNGRVDLDNVRIDIHFCRLAYGFTPVEYVFFDIERMNMQERRSYVSSMERIIAAFRMNDFSDMQILNDKWKTYNLLKPYFGRDAILLSKSSDYDKFVSFVQKHPIFIKKSLNLCCGESVELININDCNMSEHDLFERLLSYGKVILEERIVQSEKTAVFNESSVNTVRFFTFKTKNGIESMGFIRTGRAGAVVDNAGAGGVFATLDMQLGRVISDGCDELGNHYVVHPTSRVPYVGFQLPDWDDAVALCNKTANLFPTVKYIGWDLAHTDKGWIIVEANMAGQLVHQGSLRCGIKEELNIIMSKMDLMA